MASGERHQRKGASSKHLSTPTPQVESARCGQLSAESAPALMGPGRQLRPWMGHGGSSEVLQGKSSRRAGQDAEYKEPWICYSQHGAPDASSCDQVTGEPKRKAPRTQKVPGPCGKQETQKSELTKPLTSSQAILKWQRPGSDPLHTPSPETTAVGGTQGTMALQRL